MSIKVCSECKVNPQLMSDEFGIVYSYKCPECGKCTKDIICPTSTIDNPHIDEKTESGLMKEWNSKN